MVVFFLFFSSRSPASLAAAAIYLVSSLSPSHHRDYASIAGVAHISAGTIKQTFKSFYELRMELLPQNFATRQQIIELPPP